MENPITFTAGDIRLEGMLFEGSGENAAVIAHPHPQMGGDMESGVVKLAAEVYRQSEWTTLRFNFRGAGRSEGCYDHGEGEQLDLQAAIDHLRSRGGRRIDVVGYSFGAWIISRWALRHPRHGHTIVLISPPVDFLDFEARAIPGLQEVIAGGRDDFAQRPNLERHLGAWGSQASLKIIPGADHFFARHGKALRDALIEAVRRR